MPQLPPDREHQALAKEINTKLGPASGMRVDFYRDDRGDEKGIRYGIVFQYGYARRPILRDGPFFDVDEIIKDLKRWAQRL